MIIGIGTDIIEIERVARAVEREHFKNKVFTKTEQDYCESHGRQAAASYAARFAAKEAFFKAIGTGIVTDLTNVEVVNDESGQPQIFLNGKAEEIAKNLQVEKIFLSLSHSQKFATAFCVVEK